MKTDSVLRLSIFNPSSLPGGQSNRENKTKPTKSKHENTNKTVKKPQHTNAHFQASQSRTEGKAEAGINTWGRWQVDWEQVQHMMVIRGGERRGAGCSTQMSHSQQHPTVLSEWFKCVLMCRATLESHECSHQVRSQPQ